MKLKKYFFSKKEVANVDIFPFFTKASVHILFTQCYLAVSSLVFVVVHRKVNEPIEKDNNIGTIRKHGGMGTFSIFAFGPSQVHYFYKKNLRKSQQMHGLLFQAIISSTYFWFLFLLFHQI